MSDKMWNKRETAAYFGVAKRTLERWVVRGLLQKVVIGGVVRFRPGDCQELIRRGLVGGR